MKKRPKRYKYEYDCMLRFVHDPRHGWAEVPEFMCAAFGLGQDYARRANWLYLEEDCEFAELEAAAAKHGVCLRFNEVEVDDFDAWLGGEDWPGIPEAEGRDE